MNSHKFTSLFAFLFAFAFLCMIRADQKSKVTNVKNSIHATYTLHDNELIVTLVNKDLDHGFIIKGFFEGLNIAEVYESEKEPNSIISNEHLTEINAFNKNKILIHLSNDAAEGVTIDNEFTYRYKIINDKLLRLLKIKESNNIIFKVSCSLAIVKEDDGLSYDFTTIVLRHENSK